MSAPSPHGAQRRLQALIAQGWSPGPIERASGIPAAATRRALSGLDGISPEPAADVARAYDALWDKPPPRATARERSAATSHEEHAQRHGWAPPLTWDDDEIDQDDARPAHGWQRNSRHTTRAAELAEDAEFVRQAGGYRLATNTEVAMRLGVPRARLEKALERTRSHEATADREAG